VISGEHIYTPAPIWKVPTSFTTLIGREREVAAIETLLMQRHVRLLTLTGAAGVGKTRLSLEVATSLRSSFTDGVCFVDLAALSDAALVVSSLAERLEIKEGGREPITERLKRTLRDKHLLLLLDNFEHLLPAASQVEELVAACPRLHIIVTSRIPLRVRAESLFQIAPLELPDLSRLPGPEVLAHTAAVALFVQRAQAIQPGFRLTSTNARAIAEICMCLDGLPLAIELAVARLNILSPQELLARLSSRLALLTRGIWDLPERQQTLRKTIQWSYDLLSPEEQQLFRCLSVFVGGCTLPAVEGMWIRLHNDGRGVRQVLDGVASLIDKSLLQRTEPEGQESRLFMLDTIREYGLEALAERQEMEATRRAHAAY
jgi:predicted ATPase